MMGSLKRIGAILIKELQDIRTNLNVLFMYFIPILLVYVYNNFIPGLPKGFALAFSLMFLVVMVGMYVPAMIIAEEKEKGTLEVLLLSPAKVPEIFIGKGLLTFITMMASLFIILFVSGNGFANLDVILVGTVMTSVFSICLGMVVGLLAQNQMATGVVGTPIYLILLLVPLLAGIGGGVMDNIAKLIPSYYYFRMLEYGLGDQQKALIDLLPQIGMLAVSILVAFGLLLLVYRKKGLE